MHMYIYTVHAGTQIFNPKPSVVHFAGYEVSEVRSCSSPLSLLSHRIYSLISLSKSNPTHVINSFLTITSQNIKFTILWGG